MVQAMMAATMAGDAGATRFIGDVVKKVVDHGSNLKLQQIVWASLLPMVASGIWYLSRTTIVVTDSEQCLWVRLWLAQQGSAIRWVRRLKLLSAQSMTHNRNRDRFGRRFYSDDEPEKEEDCGRFGKPKLVFAPARGTSAWSWIGWWPVSISSLSTRNHDDVMDFDPRFSVNGYKITVWFAPCGTNVAKDLILDGRQIWLDKKATKTEVWLPTFNCIPVRFKVVPRPSRPLSTVVVEGTTKSDLIADAQQFLEAEQWYVGKGIPYRRGYLLHGPPGCGKTSLVYSIAGSLQLPIILLPLNSKDVSDRSLVEVLAEAPRDSIILIEDIDCALPPREDNEPGKNADKQGSKPLDEAAVMRMMYGARPDGSSVTLSGLLNAIDGVGAQEGRILFMTTNYPERLDGALTRPGRVDVSFRLGNASKSGAGELFDQFFEAATFAEFDPLLLTEARAAFLAEVQDHVHSFAKLQGVLMKARDEPQLAAGEMRKLLAATAAGSNAVPYSTPLENGLMNGSK